MRRFFVIAAMAAIMLQHSPIEPDLVDSSSVLGMKWSAYQMPRQGPESAHNARSRTSSQSRWGVGQTENRIVVTLAG